MKYISIDKILELHKKLIDATGGINGIKDIGLLESAIYHAFATFNGIDLYTSIEEKAARQTHSIIKNHPFIDGNKRIALFVMLIFLEINSVTLSYTQKELVELGLGLASGNITITDLISWIENHKNN